jgi:P27 family predicted phage terminase small subunit
MSSRGRRPKPTAVKELAGNPGHRPLNTSEPKPRASRARTPNGLGHEGGRFWRKYAPALAALGVLTEVDEPALRMAAEHYELALRAARELRQGVLIPAPDGASEQTVLTGLLIKDADDNLRKNPLLQVLRDQSAALRSYLTEFGMTPAARAKLHVQEEEQLSLADILFGEATNSVASGFDAGALNDAERDA